MAEPVLTVAGLVERGPARPGLLARAARADSDGLERRIASPYIQKTGLALAGFHEYLRPGRIVVFGESEVRYLESLTHDARMDVLGHDVQPRHPLRADHRRMGRPRRSPDGRRAPPGAAAADRRIHPVAISRSVRCSMTRSPFARSSTAC